MPPILSSKNISAWDQITITNEPIKSKLLMFRAACRYASWIMDNFSDKNKPFHVFAGIGNNGGDALVLADTLNNNGNETEASIVNFSDQRSEDFKHYYDELIKTKITIRDIHSSSDFPEIVHQVYIVLKGAHSALDTSDGLVYFNSNGNSGMATGGSDDLLTGLIASFIAQTKNLEASVIYALYIFDYAVIIALDTCGMHGLIPTRINESSGLTMATTL